ncbi:MAG: hypothetical protein Q4F84_00960 [Fibrobacter sp.]|nr:hypothetical protein [Fibrobacter sp.]
MKLKNLTWLIVLCLGMLLVGCGDDDSGSNNPVGGNGGNGGGGSQNTASIVGNWIFESMRVSLQTLRPASDEDRDIYVFSSNNSVTNILIVIILRIAIVLQITIMNMILMKKLENHTILSL